MFITLRCSREEGEEVQCIERSTDLPNRNQDSSQLACDNCRRKKLGCSREKAGCNRCRKRGIGCAYSTDKPNRRKRKQTTEIYSKDKALPSVVNSPRNNEDKSHTKEVPENNKNMKPSDIAGFRKQQTEPLEMIVENGLNISTPKRGPEQQSDQQTTKNNIDCSIFDPGSGSSEPSLVPSVESEQQTLDDCFSQFLQTFGPGQDFGDKSFDFDFEPQNIGLPTSAIPPPAPTLQPPLPLSIPKNDILGQNVLNQKHSPNSSSLTSTSGSVRDSSSDVSTGDEGCKCTSGALRILEEVAIPSQANDQGYGTEQALYFLKRNIGQCYSLVRCSSCKQNSGFTMLLITVCEKMTCVFEDVTANWERQLRGLIGNGGPNQSSALNSAGGNTAPTSISNRADSYNHQITMLIGKYQIDTVEERCEVLGSLMLLQLNKLADLMSELRKNVIDANWESHLTVLKPVNQRTKSLKATLRRLSDVAVVDS